VYIVERLLDAGSVALIFSIAMIWVPGDAILNATAHTGALANLASHHRTLALFVARYGGLVLTVMGTLSCSPCAWREGRWRHSSSTVSGWFPRVSARASRTRFAAFHSGLDTMRSWRDFAVVAGLSLSMWMLICFAYFETCRAFGR